MLDNFNPAPPPQPANPTDYERHALERFALLQKGRPEDFEYIRLLTSPPPDITSITNPGALKGKRIGVIGGGLSGLSSAFELRKTGAEITLFEADESRIGGRVYTYYFDKAMRLYGEFGAMRIPVSHETVWHYIKLLKIPTRPFIQNNQNAFIYLKNTRVRNDSDGRNVMNYIYPKYCLAEWEKTVPWQELVYYGLESPLLPAAPEQRRELLEVKPYYNSFNTYWDFQSNRRIMESLGLSEGAINLISSLSPLAGQNLYYSYIDIAQANYPANLSFLYEIPGGTSTLPYSLYNSFTDKNTNKYYPDISLNHLGNVTVKAGSNITGIYWDDNTQMVTLTRNTRQAPAPLSESFDYVICAIPFSALRALDIKPAFCGIKMEAIKEVNYIAAQKTLMLCKRRFWEEGGSSEQIIGGGSYTDLPITSIWYPSDHAALCDKSAACSVRGHAFNALSMPLKSNTLSNEPGVLIASYNYSLDTTRLANLTPDLRNEEIKRQVEEVHGLPKHYLDNIVIGFKTQNWNTYPWTRGALPYYASQQKKLFSYGMALPEYNNRVFMAGDHISAVHRWMQGALHSGMTAANQLAAAAAINNRY